VRIELSDRGPAFIPLGESTINVNGQEQARPIQVIIGDVVAIGQTTLQISVEQELAPEANRWALHTSDGKTRIELDGGLNVGRVDTAGLVLANEHISRSHARFVEKDRVIWVQDLNSADGTSINGIPIVGEVRLFHGDIVAFDTIEFQLIGEGQELTALKSLEDPLRGVTIVPAKKSAEPIDTTEFNQIREEDFDLRPVDLPQPKETGVFLLGLSESVEGETFRLVVGRNLIGRADACYLTIATTRYLVSMPKSPFDRKV